MNYELAKQLKDAGFPQYDSDWMYSRYVIGSNEPLIESKYDDSACGKVLCSCPTLSELIKECGDGYFYLNRNNGVWIAKCPHKTLRLLIDGEGSTPEEAVAKLWLKLNKNKK